MLSLPAADKTSETLTSLFHISPENHTLRPLSFGMLLMTGMLWAMAIAVVIV